MNISLRQLKMFVEVATKLNYSLACKELCISQSALSRAIQDIETQIGAILFYRSTRAMSLTESGLQFLPKAQELIKDIESAIKVVHSNSDELSGNLTIAAASSVVFTILPEVMRIFMHKYPNVRVTAIDVNSREVTKKVMNGEIDFGISSIFGDTHSINYQKIITAPIGIATNPQIYPLPTPLSLEDLEQYPFLMETNDSNVTQVLRMNGSELVEIMEKGLAISSLGSQLAMIKAGVGISAMSSLIATHSFFSNLEFVPLEPKTNVEFFIINRKQNPLSSSAKAFADLVVEYLPNSELHHTVTTYGKKIEE